MGTATQLTEDQIQNALAFYQRARNLPADAFSAERVSVIAQKLDERGIANSFGTKQGANGLQYLHAVANQVSQDEWVQWFRTGEQPTVKLTPPQMEVQKGGFIVLAALLAVALVEACVIAYELS